MRRSAIPSKLPRREAAEHRRRRPALREHRLGHLHVALPGGLAGQLPVRILEADPEDVATTLDPRAAAGEPSCYLVSVTVRLHDVLPQPFEEVHPSKAYGSPGPLPRILHVRNPPAETPPFQRPLGHLEQLRCLLGR